MMIRTLVFGAVGVGMTVGALFGPGEVRAAEETVVPPQVLGLVAVRTPLKLQCHNGDCTGFFTAFCLQEERPRPVAGQIYDPAGHGDVTLVVTKADGSVTEFSAAGLLHFESRGKYTSVEISMPEKRLASLGATEVAVRVPPRVALVPRMETPVAADMQQSDMETATGEPRLFAEGYFEGARPEAQAARVLTRLINLVPTGPAPAQSFGDRLWQDVELEGVLGDVGGEAKDRARASHDRCAFYADHGYKVTMRGCLEKSHDDLLRSLNTEYWEGEAGL